VRNAVTPRVAPGYTKVAPQSKHTSHTQNLPPCEHFGNEGVPNRVVAVSPMVSTYAAYDGGKLVLPLQGNRPAPALASFVHAQLRALVLSPDFACLGARAAINQRTYRFGMYGSLGSQEATVSLANDLQVFVDEWNASASQDPTGFKAFIASFDGPVPRSEEDFECLLWTQLQCLHQQDHAAWDPTVTSDPADPAFSFSFAGRAFFVVGLHPGSSRWTRRFAWPTLVFNAHEQFEYLRTQGKFTRFRDAIRERELNLQGSNNPMLTDHGAESEARQYSGRAVEAGWRCPFHAKASTDSHTELPASAPRDEGDTPQVSG
jgi:FPC/CPF motif-containing protein YcgG